MYTFMAAIERMSKCLNLKLKVLCKTYRTLSLNGHPANTWADKGLFIWGETAPSDGLVHLTASNASFFLAISRFVCMKRRELAGLSRSRQAVLNICYIWSMVFKATIIANYIVHFNCLIHWWIFGFHTLRNSPYHNSGRMDFRDRLDFSCM